MHGNGRRLVWCLCSHMLVLGYASLSPPPGLRLRETAPHRVTGFVPVFVCV
jgi:hypothetical protein